MAIPYVKQTWTDGSGGGTPLSAARMGVLEQAAFDAHYMPAVSAYHNANQSITNSTNTTLAFNSERFDTASNTADTMHDLVTNNSRLTCRYAGKYLITASVAWAAVNTTGFRQAWIQLSTGSTILVLQRIPAVNDVQHHVLTRVYDLAVNEYVEVLVNQTSGGALNVTSTANYSPEFSMVRVA